MQAFIGSNKALAKQFEEIHETIGNVGYFLIAYPRARLRCLHGYRQPSGVYRDTATDAFDSLRAQG